jgi:hypothetical protein
MLNMARRQASSSKCSRRTFGLVSTLFDSGFCVLKAIIKLRKMGVFACALIKKWQSWPIGVPGDAMQRRFDRPEVKVGDVDAITGVQDDVPYFIWGMKEPDYVMKMMATGGPLGSTDEC